MKVIIHLSIEVPKTRKDTQTMNAIDNHSARRRKKRNFRLTHNWLISYVCILLLPIFLCLIYGIYTYHSVKTQNTKTLLNNLAQKVSVAEEYLEDLSSHYYNFYINTSVQKIQVLTGTISPQKKYYLMQLQNEIQNIIKTQSKLDNIIIYFPNTQIMVDSKTYCTYELATKMDNPPIKIEFLNSLLSSVAKNRAPHFTYYATKDQLFLASQMHTTALEEMSSFIIFELNPQLLLDYLKTDIEGTTALITNSSDVLFHKNSLSQNMLLDIQYQLPEISHSSVPDEPNLFFSHSGDYYFSAISSSSLENFFYIYVTERNIYDHALVSTIIFFLMIMVLSLVLGSLLISYFIKKNYRPVQTIISHINPKPNGLSNEYNIILDTIKSNSAELKHQQLELSNNYLLKMLTGEISYEESVSNQSCLLPTISDSHLCVSLVELRDYPTSSKDLYLFITKNVLEDLLKPFGYNVLFGTFSSSIAVIISCNQPNDNDIANIYEQHRILYEFFKKNSPIVLSIGFSDHWTSKNDLHVAYTEAKETVEYINFYQRDPVFLHSMLPKSGVLDLANIYNTKEVVSLVTNYTDEQLLAYFDILHQQFSTHSTTLAEGKNLIYFYCQLLTELQRLLRSRLPGISFNSWKKWDEKLLQTNLTEATVLTKQYFLDARQLLALHKNNHMQLLVQQVRTYIDNNYFDVNMNQTTIAEYFHITPAYLSQKFKDEYAMSMIQYLYSVRIEHSLNLLKENKLKISEIATIVGFSNANSYIRVFKQFMGISPGKYIEEDCS